MRVLILSCNTGQGHNSASAAVKEVFEQHGVSCEITDALQFVSGGVSKFISWGHSFVYRRLPGLFRVGYSFFETHSGAFQANSLLCKFLSGAAERLHRYCQEGQYDTVISAHVFASLILTCARRQCHLNAKTYFVATDYTCSPGAVQSGLGHYFIPSAALAEEFVAAGAQKEALVPVGIPIRQKFFAAEDGERAKERFGIAPGHRHLLMMCGSMGCGPMGSLAKHLVEGLSGDQELSIVCGTNKGLERKLSRRFRGKANVHVLGYVEEMPLLMDSADLYLTKPGGISVTEAAAKRLPMVLVDAVAGCEKHNMRYYIDREAAVTAKSPRKLARLCVEILGDEDRLKSMKTGLGPELCGNGARNMFGFVMEQSGGTE